MASSTFPAVAEELDQVLALLVRDYIESWYSEISLDNAFPSLLLDSFSTLTRKLEDAILGLVLLSKIDFLSNKGSRFVLTRILRYSLSPSKRL